MAYQKLQTERAIDVIPTTGSTTIIPDPGKLITSNLNGVGASTAAATGITSNDATLTDTGKDFVALGVKSGDIVKIAIASGDTKYYTIKSVATTVLTLISGTAVFDETLATKTAGLLNVIYSVFSSEGTEPCVLYVGGAGNVNVETAGGDQVTFKGVPAGTFIPVQVTKIFNVTSSSPVTTATDIIALR
tara:strand:+ start:31 stop:597 length:567 start_codon:yes stop_codon:yes gene_type:complete